MDKSRGKHVVKESATTTAMKLVRESTDNGLRVCQIMSNVFDAMAKDGNDPFYADDVKLVEYLTKYRDG